MRSDAPLAPTLAAATDLRWPALDPCADLVNPALGLGLLVLLVLAIRAGRTREAIGLPLTLLIMLVLAYGTAHVDRVLGLADRFDLNFSTHGAVHLAAWATVLAWHPRAWPLAAGIALAYHAFMVAQGYHSAADLAVTVATAGLLVAATAVAIRRRWRASRGGTG
ncbi:MAG: hypothetical protein ACK5VV_01785 [Lysobacteraceae bacterium]